MNNLSMIKNLIDEGCSITYKNKLTICNLDAHDYSQVKFKRGYQVHSDVGKIKHSEVYTNVEDAIKDFVKLKRQIK